MLRLAKRQTWLYSTTMIFCSWMSVHLDLVRGCRLSRHNLLFQRLYKGTNNAVFKANAPCGLGQFLLFRCLLFKLFVAKCHVHHQWLISSAAAALLIVAMDKLKERERHRRSRVQQCLICFWTSEINCKYITIEKATEKDLGLRQYEVSSLHAGQGKHELGQSLLGYWQWWRKASTGRMAESELIFLEKSASTIWLWR